MRLYRWCDRTDLFLFGLSKARRSHGGCSACNTVENTGPESPLGDCLRVLTDLRKAASLRECDGDLLIAVALGLLTEAQFDAYVKPRTMV